MLNVGGKFPVIDLPSQGVTAFVPFSIITRRIRSEANGLHMWKLQTNRLARIVRCTKFQETTSMPIQMMNKVRDLLISGRTWTVMLENTGLFLN